jgi:hypothetical protein
MEMIRVVRGKEVAPGIWAYSAGPWPVEGRSRHPLSDACRQLKALGVDTRRAVGRFREGSSVPDLVCSIEVGSAWRVRETGTDGPRFVRWEPFKQFLPYGWNR